MSAFLINLFDKSEMSLEEKSFIASKFKQVKFKKGDYLLSAGSLAHHYWYVESGSLRAYALNQAGEEITTHFYFNEDIVMDWTAFFLRQPMQESIQALSDCTCWELDFNSFQTLFHSIQNFREFGRATLVRSYTGLKQLHLDHITMNAKDRYLQLLKEKPSIIQNATLKHLASYLGITDTSLSRIRKELTNQ